MSVSVSEGWSWRNKKLLSFEWMWREEGSCLCVWSRSLMSLFLRTQLIICDKNLKFCKTFKLPDCFSEWQTCWKKWRLLSVSVWLHESCLKSEVKKFKFTRKPNWLLDSCFNKKCSETTFIFLKCDIRPFISQKCYHDIGCSTEYYVGGVQVQDHERDLQLQQPRHLLVSARRGSRRLPDQERG